MFSRSTKFIETCPRCKARIEMINYSKTDVLKILKSWYENYHSRCLENHD